MSVPGGLSQEAGGRIAAVDGLRAIAVLGVIWVHVWTFCGNPKLSIGHWGTFSWDVQRALAIVGTGVDLFFVISGFCMYLLYIRKQKDWDWSRYAAFIKRRWLRLSPAFYAAVLLCALGAWLAGRSFPWRDLAAHLTFTHGVIPGTDYLAAPFWSLATEWHFYMLLPLVLWGSLRWGFRPVILLLIVSCIAFRAWMFSQPDLTIELWTRQLPPRIIEFCWGICVAHWTTRERNPPEILRGGSGFLVGLAVAYAGRIFMCGEMNHWGARAGVLFQIIGEPVLTLGYGLMLWNVISGPSIFVKALSHPVAQAIGRWSYSLYLWHWWPSYFVASRISGRFGPTLFAQYLAFGILLLFIIPVGWLSYEWLEAPYFRKRREGSSS